MKKFLAAALVGFVAKSASGALAWQLTAANLITNTNGTTPLPSDPGAGSGTLAYEGFGYFIQLIYAGPNNVPDALSLSGNGASVDDVVIDTAYIGRGQSGAAGSGTNPNGSFARQAGTSETTIPVPSSGASFFIRAFNSFIALPGDSDDAPATAFPSTATHYGNSNLRQNAVDSQAVTEELVFNGFSTNIPVNVVPEPTTAGLMGMGLLGVIAALRKRKQQA